MNRPLQVLMIGAGWAAHRHCEAVLAAGDRVAAVVDPDPGRRAALCARGAADGHGTLGDWHANGPEVDAAVVASPSVAHLQQVSELARLGIPVLVEKPHRLPGESPDEVLALVERTGVAIQVGMSTRFGEGMRSLRAAMRDRTLGQVLWATDRIWYELGERTIAPWYMDQRASGGGVLVTNGVHALDRVAWLLDEPLELLDCALHRLVAERSVEDAGRLRLATPSGVDVSISLLWAPFAVPASELRIVGTHGTGAVHADGSWSIAVAGEEERRGGPEPETGPFVRQWEAFRAAAIGRSAPDPDVATVERALSLIEAAYATHVTA